MPKVRFTLKPAPFGAGFGLAASFAGGGEPQRLSKAMVRPWLGDNVSGGWSQTLWPFQRVPQKLEETLDNETDKYSLSHKVRRLKLTTQWPQRACVAWYSDGVQWARRINQSLPSFKRYKMSAF